jgi:hypothetical protein
MKILSISGDDVTCLNPLPAANGSFAFEQLVNYYCDSDGDTYISAAISGNCIGAGCAPSGCQTNMGTDCDDSNNAISPAAPEGPPGAPTCEDNLDNDCDGVNDMGDMDCHVSFESNCFNGIDDDADGMTDCADPDCAGATNGVCVTGQPGICSTGTLTCQAGASVCVADNMPQTEVCDGLDNNCDSSVDEGCNDDGDGYCDNAMTVSGAPVPVCTLTTNGPGDDCNDNDSNIYPGGPSVRIAGTLPEYFMSIQLAYSSPASIKVIQTQSAVLQEDLLFDVNKTVTFEAGYDCGYLYTNGKTIVSGSMTISGGVVTISSGTLELQ